MFQLELYDRKGVKLELGDIVKVSDGRAYQFYAEVKYIPEKCVIAPFHTFSFHSFEKIDKLPEDAIECNDPEYRIWYITHPEHDEDADNFPDYLMSWRECERFLEKSIFRIKLAE